MVLFYIPELVSPGLSHQTTLRGVRSGELVMTVTEEDGSRTTDSYSSYFYCEFAFTREL